MFIVSCAYVIQVDTHHKAREGRGWGSPWLPVPGPSTRVRLRGATSALWRRQNGGRRRVFLRISSSRFDASTAVERRCSASNRTQYELAADQPTDRPSRPNLPNPDRPLMRTGSHNTPVGDLFLPRLSRVGSPVYVYIRL